MAMSLGSSSSRRRRGGSRRTPMAEINVTPFVDVMLVLLIIFMVTAPLLNSGVPLDLPDSRANAMDNEAQSITISLDAEGMPLSTTRPCQRAASLRRSQGSIRAQTAPMSCCAPIARSITAG